MQDTYAIERELGGGGMSRVFLARETALDRLVVIKVLPADLMGGVSVERFRREIQLAARLQQANIVPLLAAGEVDGAPYYVMPFVQGESLRAHLTSHGALPMAEVISLSRDMARALAAAHALGVVHRDIKPENVLLSGGAAVITDFGIAKALRASRVQGAVDSGDERPETLTQLGTSLGTPAYMAPEQAAGDPATDHRADVYAFGALMYEMLAGRPVFTGKTAHELIAAHISQSPEPIATLRRETPPALADLVMQCLAKDPAARPSSADAILASLDAVSVPTATRPSAGRALAIYFAAFAIVALVAHLAIVDVGLPTWVMPAVLAVMALGLPATIFLTPTRSVRGGLAALSALALFVAAYMVLRAFGIGPVGSLFAEGVINAKDHIVVSDFRAVHADSTFGAMLAEAVRTGLAQSTAISVVARASVDTTLKRMGRDLHAPLDLRTARDVARRDGAKAVVDGDVSGVSGGYLVSLRLVAAEDGRELASFHAAANNPQGLIEAADALVRDLRAKIGESLRTVNAMPALYNLTTSSVDALREYTLAAHASSANDLDAAVTHYRAAVRLDSNFAVAWSDLASILGLLRLVNGEDSAEARAYQLRDHLSHREQLEVTGSYFGFSSVRDPIKATQAFQQLVDEGDSAQLSMLATLLLNQRAYARAEPLFRAEIRSSESGADDASSRLNLVAVLFNEGKAREAQAEFDTAQRRAPRYPLLPWWDAELAYNRGDLSRAARIADSLRTSGGPAQRVWGARRTADFALLHGQLSQWERGLRDANAADVSRGNNPAPRNGAFIIAYVETLLSPTPERAVARFDSALAAAPADTGLPYEAILLAADTYALGGRPDRARAVLARYGAMPVDSVDRRTVEPSRHRLLGEIALAERHWPQAIAEMKRSDTTVTGVPASTCRICLYALLGRAYDAAGMADSAIANYEKYLTTPLLMRGSSSAGFGGDPYMLGLVYHRLGDLYDKKGDRAHALDYDTRFVDLWKNADPELQPWVTAARARVQALQQHAGP